MRIHEQKILNPTLVSQSNACQEAEVARWPSKFSWPAEHRQFLHMEVMGAAVGLKCCRDAVAPRVVVYVWIQQGLLWHCGVRRASENQ